jgi:O-antigen biosynthesis protein
LGSAAYVVLINSDVVVVPGWLERLLKCADSDPQIGAVNPLTNHASQIGVPMAPGANFLGTDRVLAGKVPRGCLDVVTGVGFCLLLRRTALDDVGLLDEVYGHGYCEESDLCMRLTTAGWRTVVSDNVYVYHKGRGSFRDRDQRYKRNREIFDVRWKKEYERQYRRFRAADPLAAVRALFRTPQRWEPMPVVWDTARGLSREWRNRNLIEMAKQAARGCIRVLKNRRDIGTPDSVAKVTSPGKLRVTYVLRDLVVSGGVFSVIQLVNELILLGVEARIVATFEDPVIYDWTRIYTRPVIFRTSRELVDRFPESDIVVATLWATAPWAAEIVRAGKSKRAAYFIQDYEPWFFPQEDHVSRRRVQETYSLIDHRIVKSDWLRDMLARDGFSAAKIPLGLDLGLFYPRDVPKQGRTVLAMARPGTPRRGFTTTISALQQVKERLPDTRVVLFGDRNLKKQAIPCEYEDEGVVSDYEKLARLYSGADVFVDGSDYQGFGRCGLEAMACGTACALTNVGGVTEYARHKENALLVNPESSNELAEAIIQLLGSGESRDFLVKAGYETARNYDHRREAWETRSYFQSIMAGADQCGRGHQTD